jgi:hypothetical protein
VHRNRLAALLEAATALQFFLHEDIEAFELRVERYRYADSCGCEAINTDIASR